MALAAFHSNRTFRFASWLALWAMLLSVIVPLFHHPASMAGIGAMPLCHMAMGDGGHKQTPDNEKSKPACPICQSLNSLAQGFVTPELAGFIQAHFVSEDVVRPYQTLVVFELSSLSWPRAPPVIA